MGTGLCWNNKIIHGKQNSLRHRASRPRIWTVYVTSYDPLIECVRARRPSARHRGKLEYTKAGMTRWRCVNKESDVTDWSVNRSVACGASRCNMSPRRMYVHTSRGLLCADQTIPGRSNVNTSLLCSLLTLVALTINNGPHLQAPVRP
ncbi:hypothetical protein J6590_023616 [Homalodisca vitripennis]|nr:hypothetical protein J6590_023616 [Homalodisca vitripennis]